MPGSEVAIMAIIMVLAIMFMMIVYAMSYKTVPPHKAMVMRRQRRYPDGTTRRMVISAGGRFVSLGSGGYDMLDLTVHPVRVQMSDLQTTIGGNPAKATVDILFLVKVTSEKEGLRKAADNLADKTEDEIAIFAREAIETNVIRMFQTTSMEVIESSRDVLAGRIQSMICIPLMEMGLEIRVVRLFKANVR